METRKKIQKKIQKKIMSNLIVMTIIANLFLPTVRGDEAANLNEKLIFQSALEDYQQYKTVSTYAESLKGSINEDLRMFVLEKIRNIPNEPLPKISATGSNYFLQLQNGTKVSFQPLSIEGGRYSINNQQIIYNDETPPQEIWNAVLSALPSQVSGSFSDYFVASAQASELFLLVAAAGASLIFIMAVTADKRRCLSIVHSTDACKKDLEWLKSLPDTPGSTPSSPDQTKISELRKELAYADDHKERFKRARCRKTVKVWKENTLSKGGSYKNVRQDYKPQDDYFACIHALIEKANKAIPDFNYKGTFDPSSSAAESAKH